MSWFDRTFGSLGAADAEADRREPMPDGRPSRNPQEASAAPSALDGGNAHTAKAFPPSSAHASGPGPRRAGVPDEQQPGPTDGNLSTQEAPAATPQETRP